MSSPQQQLETLKERHQQAQALQNDGKPEAALEVYRAILETDDRYLPALHQVAKICETLGEFDEAIAASRKAIEVDENPPFWVYRHLGFSLSQKGDLDEAIAAYKQAIALNPEDAITYGLLGQVQEKKGNIDGAIASYQRAIELSSELPIWVYLNLGKALSHQGRVEEAISAYQKALALEPEHAGIQQLLEAATARKDGSKNGIGRAQQLQREGQLDEALAEYQAVLAQDSNNLAALHQMALICESQGKWHEAIEGYRKAIEVDSEPPFWIYRHLGFALSQQGNLDGAVKAYEKALALSPEDAAAQSLLQQVKKTIGKDIENIEKEQLPEQVQPIAPKLDDDTQSIRNLVQDLFDEAYYLEHSPDVAAAEIDSLMHYINQGYQEGRDPNPLFDSAYYLQQNPDVEAASLNPLIHYIESGYQEGKDPNPLFNSAYYLQQNQDVKAAGLNPLAHYLSGGYKEGRDPNPLFDSAYYLQQNPDVEAAGLNPLAHYLNGGHKEGRDPNPLFDSAYYLQQNQDVEAAGLNPLAHYLYNNCLGNRHSSQSSQETQISAIADWRKYKFAKHQLKTIQDRKIRQVSVQPAQILDIEESQLEHYASQLNFVFYDRPLVSIIVPVFNEIKYTIECLISLEKYTTDIPYEVIIADDCSSDETQALLSGIENINYIRNTVNLGFLLSCNSASRKVRGEYLLLLNNDVQVTEDWLAPLLETFEKFESVGAVGSKIVYPSGHLQEAGVQMNRKGESKLLGLNDDPNLPRYNYVREVEYCSGACLMVKTSLFKALGGFDREYQPAYFEDADLCFRIREQGFRVFYNPHSVAVHHLSISSNSLKSNYKLMLTTRNKQKFCQRWQERIDGLNTAKLIAFYLPQYHPVAENNRWWGKGFTEWVNVAKARPNYVGHYQPHIPKDLGFYDLRLAEVMEHQAELATKYGIYGFCYYYYWFGGKRLLEMPIDRIISSDRSNMPFCLAWANENWTRHWNGQDGSVLMEQKHSDEDDRACILDLIRYLRHPSYIRVNGKPIVLIYRAKIFPNIQRTLEIWRNTCIKEGLGEIYLVMVESFETAYNNFDNPLEYGFDASVEFPPHNMGIPALPTGKVVNEEFKGSIYDYREVPLRWMSQELPGHTRFPGVMPSWDNTARQQDKGTIFEYASPGIYQAWLEAAIAQTLEHNFGDERLVFINAWNEWAEGAHLEPDRQFGHRWLEATRNALDSWLLSSE